MTTATARTVSWFANPDHQDHVLAVFSTALGWMGFEWSEDAVQRSVFGHKSPQTVLATLRASAPTGGSWQSTDARCVGQAPKRLVTRLQRFATRPTDDLTDIPIAWDTLSTFQRRVLAACRRIRPGQTSTYRDLAVQAGSPGAARAAGNVMKSNRFAPIVPCHRVLASGGGLGGYSAPAGLDLKRRILSLESARRVRR